LAASSHPFLPWPCLKYKSSQRNDSRTG
jgi:hypothetical protein